jgi:hypothetical protein
MGYRSEVCAVFYCHNQDDYPSMKLFVDENFPIEESEWMKEHIHEELVGEQKYIRFQVDDVKWYDSYPSVQAFNDFVVAFKELADGEDSKLTWAYEFVRIGEELSDIEEDYSSDANNVLNVSRIVDINF